MAYRRSFKPYRWNSLTRVAAPELFELQEDNTPATSVIAGTLAQH